jgi:hypothetical protein
VKGGVMIRKATIAYLMILLRGRSGTRRWPWHAPAAGKIAGFSFSVRKRRIRDLSRETVDSHFTRSV